MSELVASILQQIRETTPPPLPTSDVDLTQLSIHVVHRDKIKELGVRRLTRLTVYASDGRRFSREDGHTVGISDIYDGAFLTPATLAALQQWPEEWTRPKDAKRKLPHLLPVVRNEFRLRGVVAIDEVIGFGYSEEEVSRIFYDLTKVGEIERTPEGAFRAKVAYTPNLTDQPAPPAKQPPLTPKPVPAPRPSKVGLVVRQNSDTAHADPSAAHAKRYCRCGCETPCKSTFAPGHDARFFGRANRLQQGKPRPADTEEVPPEVIQDMLTVEIPHHYAKPVK